MKTQRELRHVISVTLARREYDEAAFGKAVNEFIADRPDLDKVVNRLVKWTSKGVWVRFIHECWCVYRQYRELFGRIS